MVTFASVCYVLTVVYMLYQTYVLYRLTRERVVGMETGAPSWAYTVALVMLLALSFVPVLWLIVFFRVNRWREAERAAEQALADEILREMER